MSLGCRDHEASDQNIVHLNVGGVRFSTSRQTLTWNPDTFFTSLLSGRISTTKDETNAIFIDRDPKLFSVILNFLRTKEVQLRNVDLSALRHEAEFYGLNSLVKRLGLCKDLDNSSCGGVLFHGYFRPPSPPVRDTSSFRQSIVSVEGGSRSNIVRHILNAGHARNFPNRTGSLRRSEGRNENLSNSAAELSQSVLEPPQLSSHMFVEPLRVKMLRGHQNWICAAYPHFVSCYRMKDSTGWHLIWKSQYMDTQVEKIALNAKVSSAGQDSSNKMVAASSGCTLWLWAITDEGESRTIGIFDLHVLVDNLFFIGSQLVALSRTGKVGVWHSMTHNWQIQDVVPITSYDTAGSFLLLGCNDGSIYYIDMQKFPLRMKDNDLLVTELYTDPAYDTVTALSVYLTPRTRLCGNWIEIAYGTITGTVRVIVQHPETVGHGPQLFQTFTVHRSPVTKVMLSEKHLVSVCSEYNHVRTWNVTRFRGMISTQPGSTPLASFKILSLPDLDPLVNYSTANDFGPFGEQDDQQLFVQKVVSDTDQLFVRFSSSGQRVCVIKSVDTSTISSFCVHECEGSNRMGSCPRRYLFTGHVNGSVQMWDLTTALDIANKSEEKRKNSLGGPSADELVRLLEHVDISMSVVSTPNVSPSPSVMTDPNSVSFQSSAQLVHKSSTEAEEQAGPSCKSEDERVEEQLNEPTEQNQACAIPDSKPGKVKKTHV